MSSGEALLQFIGDFWALILLITTWIGIAGVLLRRSQNRRRDRFTRQVNFAINYVENDQLKIRTLLEASAWEVWLSEHVVRQVQLAADHTSVDQPFLRLRSVSDMDAIKQGVVNVLSERFSTVFIARSLGMDVHTDTFVFAITWERSGHAHTRKLRVIVIRRQDLEDLFGLDNRIEQVRVATPVHADRLTTLRQMYQLDRSRRARQRRVIGEVELGVTLPSLPAPSEGEEDEPEAEPTPPPEIHTTPAPIVLPPPLPVGGGCEETAADRQDG